MGTELFVSLLDLLSLTLYAGSFTVLDDSPRNLQQKIHMAATLLFPISHLNCLEYCFPSAPHFNVENLERHFDGLGLACVSLNPISTSHTEF